MALCLSWILCSLFSGQAEKGFLKVCISITLEPSLKALPFCLTRHCISKSNGKEQIHSAIAAMKNTLHEFLPAALPVELSYFIRKNLCSHLHQPEGGELGGYTTIISTLRHDSAKSGELCGNTTTIPTSTAG